MHTIGSGVQRVNFISPEKKPNAFENVGTNNNNNDDEKITVQNFDAFDYVL